MRDKLNKFILSVTKDCLKTLYIMKTKRQNVAMMPK